MQLSESTIAEEGGVKGKRMTSLISKFMCAIFCRYSLSCHHWWEGRSNHKEWSWSYQSRPRRRGRYTCTLTLTKNANSLDVVIDNPLLQLTSPPSTIGYFWNLNDVNAWWKLWLLVPRPHPLTRRGVDLVTIEHFLRCPESVELFFIHTNESNFLLFIK